MRRFPICRSAVSALALLLAGALDAQEERAGGPRASVRYEHARFLQGPEPWHVLSAELSTRGRLGALIGRATLAERFSRQGLQLEADAYPMIASGVYGYLNVGLSPSGIFPGARVGGEVFANLPAGWEASAGFRRLWFDTTRVTILTGALGRYVGNYWISARPFVTPGRPDGTAASAQLSMRRYFRDADEYVTVTAGGGTAPGDAVVEAELERLRSARVGLDGKWPVGRALHLTWAAGYEHEELRARRDRRRATFGLGLETRF